MMRKSKYCTNYSPVYISDNMSGKMEGIPCISTSCTLNPFCQARAKNPCSICAYCYAEATINRYKALGRNLEYNTELLTKRILDPTELPIFKPAMAGEPARFEAFGDLINVIQAINYINIARNNPDVNFALWSKNEAIWQRACDMLGKPDNLKAIYSSPNVDEYRPAPRWFDASFTVWSSREKCEAAGFEINCAGRKCKAECRVCYQRGPITDRHELLRV
jgi:hypothetical protein